MMRLPIIEPWTQRASVATLAATTPGRAFNPASRHADAWRREEATRRLGAALDRRYKRMSNQVLPRGLHDQPNGLPNSPTCDTSCPANSDKHLTSLYNINPQPLSQGAHAEFHSRHGKWPDTEPYRPAPHYERQGVRYPTSPYQPNLYPVEDHEAFKRKPIEDWMYADVIFFLMEACRELAVNPGEVKFKSSDNGAVLLRMGPSEFEILAPNNGQKLYEYFISFKTSHYMATGLQMHPPLHYQGRYDDAYPPPDQHQLPHHHGNPPTDAPFPPHYDACPEMPEHHSPFQASPYHSSPSYAVESPSNEYVPQGLQYGEVRAGLKSDPPRDPLRRKSYPLPSAAGKSFPPLHDDHPHPEELEEEPPPTVIPQKRRPGRPPKPESERKRKTKKTGRLWEFIRNLLLDPKTCPSMVKWENAQTGVFRIVQSDAIANKWGMRKNNEKMNYEKLSRAMRYYYKAKIFEPVLGKRLVYKFGCNAKGWRPLNPNSPNFQTPT